MTKYNVDRNRDAALGVYANLVRATDSVAALLSRQLDGFGLTMGQFRVLEALLPTPRYPVPRVTARTSVNTRWPPTPRAR